MNARALLVFLLVLMTSVAFAQSRKSKKKPATPAQQQPTTLNPEPQKTYAPKPARKSADGPTFESEQRYYERMEAVAKERRKAEKLLSRPQYSNPMYFGHKRPPKKRKPGKMKYCRECGIRH